MAFSKAFVFSAALLLAPTAFATTTRVGNGDDGRDLEALKPITAGPILDARVKAANAMRALNTQGIPGLSALIPEIERTDLLLAKSDTAPTTEAPGSAEISPDTKNVYARTFAEPYAATRFFPIAETLTEDQLIALHVHEALHRALPEKLRGDENAVTHLTLALTSPGATYDRVRMTAALYLKDTPKASSKAANIAPATSTSEQTLPSEPDTSGRIAADLVKLVPAKSRTQVAYELDLPTQDTLGFNTMGSLQTIQVKSALAGFQKIGSLEFEPVLRLRSKTYGFNSLPLLSGTTSVDLQGRISVDESTDFSPFVRYTLGENYSTNSWQEGRDIATFGAFYRSESKRRYFDSSMSYSLPSSLKSDSSWRSNIDYSSVISLTVKAGFKLGKFRLGGIGELHSSNGIEVETNPDSIYSTQTVSTGSFRSILLGPEIGFQGRKFEFKAHAKWVLNGMGDLSNYGDIMDRGTGAGQVGTAFAMNF